MSEVLLPSREVSSLGLIKERFIYGLIFLFPIAGVGVRHWFSGIFSVLVLISLWDFFRRDKKTSLFTEEKIWLWLCVGFFLSYLLSGLANGMDRENNYLGVEIRYLFLVPLYLMLREYQHAWRYLLAGVMLAALYVAGLAYYEVFVLGQSRATGVYSPNLLGPFAALVAVWLLASWQQWGKLRWLMPLLVMAALWAVVMSGSRAAYLGVITMGLAWSLLYFRGWWRLLPVLLVLLTPFLAYHASDRLASRVDTAVDEVSEYFRQLEQGKHYVVGNGFRLEMWRAGWVAFKDAPVLGVGRGNYHRTVKRYVDQGLFDPMVANSGHAHNVYIDVLMGKGLIGFVIFMGMLFYPLYYFLKTRHVSPHTAVFGILHVVGFAVFSITDASTFIKGNFVAIFLLCLTVFFSRHVALVNKKAV